MYNKCVTRMLTLNIGGKVVGTRYTSNTECVQLHPQLFKLDQSEKPLLGIDQWQRRL